MRAPTRLGGVAVAALALALVAPAAAQAAPVPITATYASSAAAPAATWAGLEPLDAAAVGPTERTFVDDASIDLRVHEPAAASGRVLSPDLAGVVTLDVDQLAAGGSAVGSTLTSSPTAPTGEPTGWPGANDTLTSSLAIEQPTQRWAYAYTFDFTGLAGGVLPVGSRIAAADIDVCSASANERFGVTSDASGAFLSYDYRLIRSGETTPTATVTYDADANAYAVAPQCVDRDMIEVFTTTQEVSTLRIELGNRQGAGVARFSLLLPTAAPAPAIALDTTTNGEDVVAAPGPSVPVGSPVTWDFAVTNAGNTALADVTVTDDALEEGAIDCGDGTASIALLAVGATTTCTASGVAVEGQYESAATATGTPVTSAGEPIPGATAPTATDASWYLGVEAPAPSLTIESSVDLAEASVGDSLTYTLVATNTGVDPLDALLVGDELPEGVDATSYSDGGVEDPGTIEWLVEAPLAGGESATFTVTVVVVEAEEGATLENRAYAVGFAEGAPAVATSPLTACDDEDGGSCVSTTVVAAAPPTTTPPTTAPPSPDPTDTPPTTPPGGASPTPGAGGGSGGPGSLPDTGAEWLPFGAVAGMATLLVGLGLVLRRRSALS